MNWVFFSSNWFLEFLKVPVHVWKQLSKKSLKQERKHRYIANGYVPSNRCLLYLQPTVLQKGRPLLLRFFVWHKENSQLMLNMCNIKNITRMTGKCCKHSRAHCFPPVPKTAELTPGLYCGLLNSENKFMGDQPSSSPQFLTATIFSKYTLWFFGHWAFHS